MTDTKATVTAKQAKDRKNLVKSIAAARQQAEELRRGAADLEATARWWETLIELKDLGWLKPKYSR